MPKSTRQTGINYQNWCEKWILQEFPGARVHNFKPMSKPIRIRNKEGKLVEIWVSKDQDLWNCIDLAVILPHCPKPLFIQCTVGYELGRKARKMQEVPWDFDHAIVQLWRKVSKTRHKIAQAKWGTHPPSTDMHCFGVRQPPLVFTDLGEIISRKYIPIIGTTLCKGE